MKKVANLLFYLITFLSINTTFANEMVFGYNYCYSDTKIMIDLPATNTGLHWMKKKKKESKPVTSKKKRENRQYLCYGSLRSTANAFQSTANAFQSTADAFSSQSYSRRKCNRRSYSQGNCDIVSYSHGNYDRPSVSVKSHTRKLKNGKRVMVKAHRRRR